MNFSIIRNGLVVYLLSVERVVIFARGRRNVKESFIGKEINSFVSFKG